MGRTPLTSLFAVLFSVGCSLILQEEHERGIDATPDAGDAGDAAQETYASCLELHVAHPELPSGVYPTQLADDPPVLVWCDMELDGGGWTALTNPVNDQLPPLHPDLEVEVVGGETPVECEGNLREHLAHGQRGVALYRCWSGFATAVLTWRHPQWEIALRISSASPATSKVFVNGTRIVPDSVSAEKGVQCAFWNLSGLTAHPETHPCRYATIDDGPRMIKVPSREPVQLIIHSGPATHAAGTGWNIVGLEVR